MVFDLTCLATRKAKRRSRSSALVGARLVTGFNSMSSTTALSRVCTSKPPATVLAVSPAARGSGRPPASSSRKFFLAPTMAMASAVASGAMMTSVKISVMARAASASSVRLSATMPPNAEIRSQAKRLAIGVDQTFAFGDAARIGVLDDGASRRARRIELGDAFVSGVGVVDVVVGELLALRLPRGGDAETRVRRAIERRRLMRVLAVAQRLDQPAAEGAIVRRGVVELAARTNWRSRHHKPRCGA